VRLDDDEPVGGQPPECLADGCAAYPSLARQSVLDEFAAHRVCSVENPMLDVFIGPLGSVSRTHPA